MASYATLMVRNTNPRPRPTVRTTNDAATTTGTLVAVESPATPMATSTMADPVTPTSLTSSQAPRAPTQPPPASCGACAR